MGNRMENQVTDEQVQQTVEAVLASYAEAGGLPLYRHPLYVGVPLPGWTKKLPAEAEAIGMAFPSLEQIIRGKLEMMAEYRSNKNWAGMIWGTERPFRLNMLLDLLHEGAFSYDDALFSELLTDVWTDCESPHVNDATWRELFSKANPVHMLDKSERLEFDKLPDTITVYRGTSSEEVQPIGLSFTLDRDTAVWFAKRWAGYKRKLRPVLITATGNKADVIGPLNSRGESEILCPHLDRMKVRRKKL